MKVMMVLQQIFNFHNPSGKLLVKNEISNLHKNDNLIEKGLAGKKSIRA
jgi:hypothetical protein